MKKILCLIIILLLIGCKNKEDNITLDEVGENNNALKEKIEKKTLIKKELTVESCSKSYFELIKKTFDKKKYYFSEIINSKKIKSFPISYNYKSPFDDVIIKNALNETSVDFLSEEKCRMGMVAWELSSKTSAKKAFNIINLNWDLENEDQIIKSLNLPFLDKECRVLYLFYANHNCGNRYKTIRDWIKNNLKNQDNWVVGKG